MSLPDGWTPLPFDPARGVPQVVPLPGPVPGLRAAVVAGTADLARLLSAPTGQVVHDTGERLLTSGPAAGPDVGTPAHVATVDRAVAAFTAAAPDSLATSTVGVWIVVTAGSTVHCTWPALPGRALPVRGDGRLLGDLWIDELRLAAGSLVRPGEHGSRIAVGWRPAGTPTPPGTVRTTAEEDPHVGLI